MKMTATELHHIFVAKIKNGEYFNNLQQIAYVHNNLIIAIRSIHEGSTSVEREHIAKDLTYEYYLFVGGDPNKRTPLPGMMKQLHLLFVDINTMNIYPTPTGRTKIYDSGFSDSEQDSITDLKRDPEYASIEDAGKELFPGPTNL